EVFRKFVGLRHKSVGIWRRRLLGGDIRPAFRILPVELEPFFQIWFGIGLDGVDRAFRLAHPAVDALVRVNDQHGLALVETVYGADFDAVGVLTLDANFGDDVSHRSHTFSGPIPARILAPRGRPSRPWKGPAYNNRAVSTRRGTCFARSGMAGNDIARSRLPRDRNCAKLWTYGLASRALRLLYSRRVAHRGGDGRAWWAAGAWRQAGLARAPPAASGLCRGCEPCSPDRAAPSR